MGSINHDSSKIEAGLVSIAIEYVSEKAETTETENGDICGFLW